MENPPDLKKIILGLAIGSLIIGGVIYGGYRYSQKYGFKLTLPAGENYLGKKAPDYKNLANPPTAPQRFTAGPDVTWKQIKGNIYPYAFSFPETLTLGSFPNDPTDSIAIIWGNIPPENNILLNIENIPNRDKAYAGKPEEYVRNWWRFFSGLTGLRSIQKITNTQGLKGFKAVYINTSNQSPNVDIFFEVPKEPDLIIHLANGILDPEIFSRIVDSVQWNASTPTPTQTPNPTP